jgi:hypothetical protein
MDRRRYPVVWRPIQAPLDTRKEANDADSEHPFPIVLSGCNPLAV